MDLLTTILACSVYLGGDDVVRAIAQATPAGNPYFVVDAALDLTQVDPPAPPTSAADATKRAEDLARKGGRPLLGLLELPPSWLEAFGRSLAQAFDACTNIAIGSSMLSAFDDECAHAAVARPGAGRSTAPRAHARPDAHRSCVLSKYEAAIGSPDFARTVALELRYERAAAPSLAEAPIFAPAGPAGWGQILVPSLSLSQPRISTP